MTIVGTGILSLVAPVGGVGSVMGAMLVGLLLLTALPFVLPAGRRSA